MPLLRINATTDGLALHDLSRPLGRTLREMARTEGPAVLMLHGYKYAPGSARHCPHRKILGEAPDAWPVRLGLDGSDNRAGLGIALGWYARGPLQEAHGRACTLGESVAMVVAMLRTYRPDRPVHFIAHSLGSEAALAALSHLPEGAVDRMVLLTGASYAAQALQRLQTPAGRSVEILNVTSRENDLFDAAFERLIRSDSPGDRAIGLGIDAPNVVNLQLDCPETLFALHSLGFALTPSRRRVCHWSTYRRNGVMRLYSAFLRAPEASPLSRLRSVLPEHAAPRWSRLLAMPSIGARAARLLPFPADGVGSRPRTPCAAVTGSHKNEPAC